MVFLTQPGHNTSDRLVLLSRSYTSRPGYNTSGHLALLLEQILRDHWWNSGPGYPEQNISLACSTMRTVIWRAAPQPACPGCYRSSRSIENVLPLGCVLGCPALLWGANPGDCNWYAKLGRPELTSAPPTQNRLLTFTSPIYAYATKRKSHLPIPMPSQCLFD